MSAHPVMSLYASALSDQDMKDIGAYLGKQPAWKPGSAKSKDTIELDMWLAELEKGLLFNDLTIKDANGGEHRCRYSIPLAKAAFCASCSLPAQGMMPEEILELVARSGVDKYKQVAPLGAGAQDG